MPSRRLYFAITTLALFLSCTHADAQQVGQLPKQQTALDERTKDLEKRMKDAEQKADKAEIQKAYIEQAQRDTKDYYEKVFDQVKWTVGLLLAAIGVLSGLATFRSVKWFDDRTSQAIATARADLRQEFATELQKLRDSNTEQLETLKAKLEIKIKKQVAELEMRSAYAFYYTQGLSYGVSGDHESAQDRFRQALETYTQNPACFERSKVVPGTLADLFRAIKYRNEKDFLENARKELENPLYDKVEDDLPKLAVTFEELAPLLRERKPTQDSTKKQTSSTQD